MDAQPALPSEPAHDAALPADPGSAHWQELLAQVGQEIAGPLTSAVERVNAFATTGRIDRAGLRALRDEIEAARRAGKVGQQLARFASGRVRQSPERLSLSQMLSDVLVQRGRSLQARGLPLRQTLEAADVDTDPSLLFAMLNALVDWCAEHARSTIDLRIALDGWPPQARLSARFVFQPSGDLPADEPLPSLDSLSWRLVQHAAWTMGLVVAREEQGVETEAVIRFPRTLRHELPVLEEDVDHGPSSQNSQPLAGSHVLVVAQRREVRQQVREAIGRMGLILDFVPSLAEAQEFCRGGMPHAVVYEGALGGQRFDQFRDEVRREVPGLVFVELVEDDGTVRMSGPDDPVARVGREALASSLPSTLVFELSKHLQA